MKVYNVVTIQYFDYESLVFKKKNRVIKEVFLMRNLKFIYASNNEEAIEKYNKNFRKDYGNSITGWGDWFYYSDEVSIELIDRVKKINKGRNFNDFEMLRTRCSEIILEEVSGSDDVKISVISGTARGADQLGEKFASEYGYDVIRFPAKWDLYGKSAGYRRNEEMAKFSSENKNMGMLIAFWDGKSRGTKHMIDLAKRYGLDVHIVNY